MKTTQTISHHKSLSFLTVALLLFFAFSCSEDNETPPEEEPTYQEIGKVDVDISGNTAAGTVEDPIVATASDGVRLTFTQTNSYQDSKGAVHTCEPRATISLSVKMDTVQAQTLTELLAIKEDSKTDLEGTNPKKKSLRQTFTLAGQEVSFLLQHEIYSYVDSTQRTVELPYLKLNAAKHGEAKSQETRAAEGYNAVVTGIKLTPIENVSTRGSYSSEQTYQVSVAFNVDVESEHATDKYKRTLTFKVDYVGIVETTTEYPDPTTALSVHVDLAGTNSTRSPFVMIQGTDTMQIKWIQQSTYTYFSLSEMATKMISLEPTASMKLALSTDTVYSLSVDSMQIIEKEEVRTEQSSSSVTASQVVHIGSQQLKMVWTYDVPGSVEVDGNNAEMPYMKLENPELVDVSITNQSESVLNGMECKIYELSVRIRQRLNYVSLQNATEEQVEYIVKFIGVQEIKVVSERYWKSYEWYPAHDNLWEAYNYLYYRERTYSTGETITDCSKANPAVEFSRLVGANCMGPWVDIRKSRGEEGDILTLDDTTKVYRHPSTRTYENMPQPYGAIGAHWIRVTSKVGVPDLSRLRLYTWGEDDDSDLGDYEQYGYKPDNPIARWYGRIITDRRLVYLGYNLYDDYSPQIHEYEMGLNFTDFMLVNQGQMIDFLDYAPKLDFDLREDNITMPNGAPARIYTFRMTTKFLEKDYDWVTIDTVYQFSSEERNALGLARKRISSR